MTFTIAPFDDHQHAQVLALSLRAWRPVFEQLRPCVPAYVYTSFYPQGWEARQSADIDAFLRDHKPGVWVACDGDAVIGWIGIRLHAEDRMGEVHILAVDPGRQRQGVARALLDTAFEHMRASGMAIAMVETGDDPGHAASRATYERSRFERWPVARYFRPL
jgi:GNAT superfamily N-acetyltransferase